MTVKLESLRADLAKEAAGDWIDYPDWPGVAFNVRSLMSPAYVTARDMMIQRVRRKYPLGAPPTDDLIAEAGKLYCTHILLDWRGLDIDYTPEKALETMTDPAYRAVTTAVEWCAGQVAKLDVKFVEDTTPKSGRPSAGT